MEYTNPPRTHGFKRQPAVPARDELVEYHAISVRRYASGETRATRAKLSKGTRAVVFQALADPGLECEELPWGTQALLNAATECAIDDQLQDGLW